MKQIVDYRSPEFYKIINTINEALIANNLPILPESAISNDFIKVSKFDIGKFENKIEWRITNKQVPQLFDEQGNIINNIKMYLSRSFKRYINDKTIRFGNPAYTKDFNGNAMASIIILLTQLDDNIITKQDLEDFEANDPAATKKCLEIESRMFKRADDKRSPEKRIYDFIFALKYEPALIKSYLVGISDLALGHQDEAVTLEADPKADFTGYVHGDYCLIEGKATQLPFEYIDSDEGHKTFANYFSNRLKNGSFGSIHNADYVLIVLRNNYNVICIEVANPVNNWLAGKVNI